ncbi:unnamed protein product [Prunus armeniaca]|uniref:Uncharacterized protein n=1 Tax=Prunus armeniaca TaxID=36596 RepID=A0A6J5XLK1_PRUAR|nr:unnamed protein product [Prunus armeniaca]
MEDPAIEFPKEGHFLMHMHQLETEAVLGVCSNDFECPERKLLLLSLMRYKHCIGIRPYLDISDRRTPRLISKSLLLEVKSQPVYPGDAILVALEANCVVCKLFLGYKIEKLRDRSIKLPKEGQPTEASPVPLCNRVYYPGPQNHVALAIHAV